MIEYEEEWLFLLIFRYRGSVALKASQYAIPAALFAAALRLVDNYIPDSDRQAGILGMKSSTLWTASTAILVLMLNVRTNRAMARFWEGTGLLHQMRGEWFDAVSCCITFSTIGRRTKPDETKLFRHCIVRLMSLCHAIALAEIADDDAVPITIDEGGLDDDTLKHLNICKEDYGFNRVEVLLHMTQTLIVNALEDAVLKIPPPILSRVFQTLSRGFVNLLNAKKITDTRFPFPYAQLITILLFLHMIMTPVMISNLINSAFWAAVFTFVPTFGIFSLNYVAIELENPFGDDDNDLPMLTFQREMNNCLLMLLEDNADMVAGLSKRRCIRDFKVLQKYHTELEEAPQGVTGQRTGSAFGSQTVGMDESVFEPEPEEDGGNFGPVISIAPTQSMPTQSIPPAAVGGNSTRTIQIPEDPVSTVVLAEEDNGGTAAANGDGLEPTGAAEGPAVPESPAQVARRLDNLETMLKKSVEAVEKTFEQWMLKAEGHAQALRRNTEAITQLVMVHV